MYSHTTCGIEVQVKPEFLPTHSSSSENFFLYSYRVRISNHSQEEIQVLRRLWLIRNGLGIEDKVEGEGVVGVQPLIKPGESFEYMSGCPLQTPTGNMRGSFLVRDSTRRTFRVKVPLFFLRPPPHANSFHQKFKPV